MNRLFTPLFLRSLGMPCAAIVALAFAQGARADSYLDITNLLQASKPSAALTTADERLASNPRDPQLRFLRAVAQADLGKTDEAIAGLLEITQEYPELAEPYNNLAVLYATQNQLNKARAALEAALRANPAYATAHENLGDIYARLAAQSYEQALQLDNQRSAALTPKLALIRQLSSTGPSAAKP